MNTPYNKDFQIDFNQIVSEIAANWWTDTWNQIIDVQKAYKYHKKDHYPSRELNPDPAWKAEVKTTTPLNCCIRRCWIT